MFYGFQELEVHTFLHLLICIEVDRDACAPTSMQLKIRSVLTWMGESADRCVQRQESGTKKKTKGRYGGKNEEWRAWVIQSLAAFWHLLHRKGKHAEKAIAEKTGDNGDAGKRQRFPCILSGISFIKVILFEACLGQSKGKRWSVIILHDIICLCCRGVIY